MPPCNEIPQAKHVGTISAKSCWFPLDTTGMEPCGCAGFITLTGQHNTEPRHQRSTADQHVIILTRSGPRELTGLRGVMCIGSDIRAELSPKDLVINWGESNSLRKGTHFIQADRARSVGYFKRWGPYGDQLLGQAWPAL
jgi:hypothetical protein